MKKRAILVDDDRDVREALGQSLDLAGFTVTLCKSFIEATDHLSPSLLGVVITDVRMPGKDGFDLLARALKIDPELPVIVLTGEGDIPMAVRAISEGAFDFLEKPCPPKNLIAAVERAWAKRVTGLENRKLAAQGKALAEVRATDGLTVQMEMVEKLLIEASLQDHAGRVVAVAEALDLPRKTLYDKLKRHGLDPADYRSESQPDSESRRSL